MVTTFPHNIYNIIMFENCSICLSSFTTNNWHKPEINQGYRFFIGPEYLDAIMHPITQDKSLQPILGMPWQKIEQIKKAELVQKKKRIRAQALERPELKVNDICAVSGSRQPILIIISQLRHQRYIIHTLWTVCPLFFFLNRNCSR